MTFFNLPGIHTDPNTGAYSRGLHRQASAPQRGGLHRQASGPYTTGIARNGGAAPADQGQGGTATPHMTPGMPTRPLQPRHGGTADRSGSGSASGALGGGQSAQAPAPQHGPHVPGAQPVDETAAVMAALQNLQTSFGQGVGGGGKGMGVPGDQYSQQPKMDPSRSWDPRTNYGQPAAAPRFDYWNGGGYNPAYGK